MTVLTDELDSTLAQSNAVVDGAVIGAELFQIVDVFDSDRALRVALIDSTASAQQRAELASALFSGKVSEASLNVLRSATVKNWSNTRDFRDGLVTLGRRALLRAADAQGQLETVELELFQLARLFESEPELEMLLADRQASADRRRSLLASVLYGKVTSVTEALALQAVGRPSVRPVEDCDALSTLAADLRGLAVAHVVSASALNDGQVAALAEKLGRIYGRTMSIHAEVDPSILGGMVIRVGDERIDGSTRGKLERIKRAFA